MIPVSLLHEWGKTVRPYEAAGWVLLFGSVLVLAFGLVRVRSAFWRSIPGAFYIVLASICLLLANHVQSPEGFWLWLVPAAFLLLVVHEALNRRTSISEKPHEENKDGKVSQDPSCWDASRIYLGVALLLTALFLFHNLTGFAGTLLTWESPVSRQFGDSFRQDKGVIRFALDCFLWDEGLMSGSEHSLLYGAPTYAMCRLFGFHLWSLRICSVLATLAGIAVTYLWGRRIFSPAIGSVLAIVFGMNASVLFYGRYGCSPAGTYLGLLVALYFAYRFLDEVRPVWWLGIACGLSLFLATLQYSPARLVILLLIGWIVLVLILQWRSFRLRRALATILLFTILAGAWLVERSYGAHEKFTSARGEQFFNFIQDRGYLREYLGRNADPKRLSRFEKFEVLYRVLERTIPQYLWFFRPSFEKVPPGRDTLATDPPRIRLFEPHHLPFLLWGIVFSVFRLKDWRYGFPFLWLVFLTPPLLLTNRVDAHRVMTLAIPIAVWFALGVGRAIAILRASKIPSYLGHGMAALLILVLFYENVLKLFYFRGPPDCKECPILAEEFEELEGEITFAADFAHQDVSRLNLNLLNRYRKDPMKKGNLLEERLLLLIRGGRAHLSTHHRRQFGSILERSTLVCAPESSFRAAARVLIEEGAVLDRKEEEGYRYFLLAKEGDRADLEGGAADQFQEPQPEPTPARIALEPGAKTYLSDLEAVSVDHGFAPPAIDAKYGGGPIVMGKVSYAKGIGMHAWCRMTFPVPPKASALEAVIGISDAKRDCERVSVTFVVRDEKDSVLYESGLFDSLTPPQRIEVPIGQSSRITLEVTDAGDGWDCDHANWAMAAFLLDR